MEPDKIVAISISLIAFGFSIYNFNRSRSATYYQDLDKLYIELLKLGIANPDFATPSLTKDYTKHFEGSKLIQYQLYAFMAWNICETIYDRRDSEKFFGTWQCIIGVENNLHRAWFDSDDNDCKFKENFRNYVKTLK